MNQTDEETISVERGYVKLWRKTLDSGLLQNPHAWQVFGFLLLSATHTRRTMLVGSMRVDLNPGDCVIGRHHVAEALKLSERNVRTALELLKKLEILTIRTTNKCSIVSIVNWNTYQEDVPATRPAHRPATDQQVTSNRPQNKNERMRETRNDSSNEESIPEASANPSGTQALLVPFRPSEPALVEIPLTKGEVFRVTSGWVEEMKAAYPAVDIVAEMKKCRAWSISNPKQRKTTDGVKRFLNRWLSKCQDTAARRVPDDSPEAQGWHLI